MRRIGKAALGLAAALAIAGAAAAQDWRTDPTHTESDGIAVSADGARVISASMGHPGDELRVFDLGTGAGYLLKHPDKRIVLSDPAVSPDGTRLAFVVGRPGRTRASEIWITDIDGGHPVRLGELGRAYRRPAFSPDGRRLAYFRDVDAPPAGDPREPLNGPNARAYALFERDLDSGTEARLAERRFRIPCGLAYRPQDDGFYYCALNPLLDAGLTADGLFEGDPDSLESMAYERRTGFAHVFFFRRGEPIPLWPEPYAPAGAWSPSLIGVDMAGRALIAASEPQPFPIKGKVAYHFFAFGGEVAAKTDVVLDPENCSPFAEGGGVIVAETHCAERGADGRLGPKPSRLTVVRGGKVKYLPTESFRFEALPRVMAPPGDSIFVGHP